MEKRKGFSLIELLLVLGVIIAITILAFIVYVKVQDEMVIRENQQIFNEIIATALEEDMALSSSGAGDKSVKSLSQIRYRMSDFLKERIPEGANEFKLKSGETVYLQNGGYYDTTKGKFFSDLSIWVFSDGFSPTMNTAQCIGTYSLYRNDGNLNFMGAKNIGMKNLVSYCEAKERTFMIKIMDINT